MPVLTNTGRFILNVVNRKTDECWNWDHATNDVYGVATLDGKQQSAHRISWQIFYGEIPKDKIICHECDNQLCFNPYHLFIGTHEDNIMDKVNKRRQAKGESIHMSKLTYENVKEIRRLYSTRKYKQYELAEMFGVNPSNISHIVNYSTWK